MPEPAPASNIGLYRSGVTSPERLRHTTVAREHVLDNTIASLRGSVRRKSKSHLLLIGPRGIGKTHLLSCIEDAVRSDTALGERIVVARFPEESNRILSFADFLIGLCGILGEVLEDEGRWAELLAEVQAEEDDAKVADTLVPAIRRENRRHGRTLVIMIENLGEVLSRQIRDGTDVAALRKFLMGDNGCLLVATAPMHFDGITDIRQPFYDFFDIQMLESLSFEETVEVIRRNLEWEERTDLLASMKDMRPRLEALYRMTGGNPRLTMMLHELIAHESVTRVQEQFHVLLDRISPFYQGRMADLPPGQRALLECLASMRDEEKTPAAIAARMRMSQQETSSLLKRLSDAHYLRSEQHPRDGRSRLYTIREGFFDIWLAMNLSRGARTRLPFLLEFFRLFYPSIADREKRRRELRERLMEEGGADAKQALDYLSEVGDEGERANAKFGMARTFARLGAAEQVANYVLEAAPLAGDGVSQSITRAVSRASPAPDYLSEIENMIAAWEKHRSGDLEAFAHRLAEMGEGLTLHAYSETRLAFLKDAVESVSDARERIRQRLQIATVLMELARWRECEVLLRQTLAEAKSQADAKLVARAYNDLGQLLWHASRHSDAEPLMRAAIEVTEAAFGKHHPDVTECLNNLAVLLQDTNRHEEAEPMLLRALAIAEVAFGKHHPTVATCLNNLAMLLRDTNRHREAEPMLRRALAIAEAAFGEHHPAVATCLSNLAMLLQDTYCHEEAEPMLLRALAIAEAAFGKQHPNVANRLNNLATLLHGTNRNEEAEPLMRRALDILESSAVNNKHEHPWLEFAKANHRAILRAKADKPD
ncbi:MAG: tetratricopeptide repeat protein [Boseongicola sp. SB0662_bin_57]|nr:tetratricopeptide repeat protein [Boseongicola sp. SB0662_bin_57]